MNLIAPGKQLECPARRVKEWEKENVNRVPDDQIHGYNAL